MIKDIQELNFPSYATLSSATVTLNDMGDRTISAQVKIDGSIVPDFSYDWEVEFKGERYIQPLRQPQASKGNESMRSTIDLVFYHKTIWQLKRYYFVEMTSTESGTAIADQYIASLGLNLSDFCVAFQKVLDHYFDGEISIDLNPNLDYTKGVQFMSISYSYIWDVLQKMYEVYGVRWHIEGNTIKVGYPSPILSHTFQYGYEGGLLQVERQVQDANIRNSLLGRGGEQNLPAYYFKDAPEGSLFASDPDAIPELANIYFSNLRGKTFRDYVKGWKARHYGGERMQEPTEAYTKGYTDIKFNPIEYVEDKESIEKYGLLQGALDNNEEIYPSIQNAPNGEDVVVYVEPIRSDNVESGVLSNDTVLLPSMSYTAPIKRSQEGTTIQIILESESFEVPDNYYSLVIGNSVKQEIYGLFGVIHSGNPLIDVIEEVYNSSNVKVDKNKLSKGRYYVKTIFNITLSNESYWWDEFTTGDDIWVFPKVIVSTNLSLLKFRDVNSDTWTPTFDLWVKNIWGSTRKSSESDTQYAERVWRPILGDRQGKDAKVVFSSGWLSGHEDYEFTIVDFAYDNSKEYDSVKSEWRLTLEKSDAELESTGKFIPSASTNGQAYAGDKFFFIGIDMPYEYVSWAEERLDTYKYDALREVSEIQPKWVVKFDKLRINDNDELVKHIVAGAVLNLSDIRFITSPSIALYVNSITYTWDESTTLYPDIEVVLADKITPIQNPVAQIQGSIDIITSQLSNIGNISQLIRIIGDALYLRKDGVTDISKSATKFVSEISGHKFNKGKVGGSDWGIYHDLNGKSIAEFDKIIAREDLDVNNLVINQISAIGGSFIASAASITCSRVVEREDVYQCFFDQKSGSIGNLFAIDDIAYSQLYDTENNATKYYKRVVTNIGVDYIELSKTNKDGSGLPMNGDNIVQMGNLSNKDRQGIIIIQSNPIPSIKQYDNVNSFVLPEPQTRIEPNNSKFSGAVHFEAGSTGADNIADLPDEVQGIVSAQEFGKANLLRNTSFTGDYLSRQLSDDTTLDSDSEMFSPSMEHWKIENGTPTVVERAEAVSGYGLNLPSDAGVLQVLFDKMLVGESYVLSYNLNGYEPTFEVGGYVHNQVNPSARTTKVVVTFKASSTANTFKLRQTQSGCIISNIQLERGTIPSTYGRSVYDNNSPLAYYEKLEYLKSAMTDGRTVMNGGLILSSIILLGRWLDGVYKQTSGMSGYDNENDVAFWAGGSYEQAINTVSKYINNPQYQPTEDELATMAKFVAMHSGRVILEDAIIRGYVYAEGGKFKGTVEATDGKFTGEVNATSGKFKGRIEATEGYFNGEVKQANGNTLLSTDGSGQLAGGNISWDKEGNSKFEGSVYITKGLYMPPTLYGSNELIDNSIIISENTTFALVNTAAANGVVLPEEATNGQTIIIKNLTSSRLMMMVGFSNVLGVFNQYYDSDNIKYKYYIPAYGSAEFKFSSSVTVGGKYVWFLMNEFNRPSETTE